MDGAVSDVACFRVRSSLSPMVIGEIFRISPLGSQSLRKEKFDIARDLKEKFGIAREFIGSIIVAADDVHIFTLHKGAVHKMASP